MAANTRALRLELLKPLGGDSWETVGSLLRLLADATPKLQRAALDARISCAVAGTDAVKAKVAPNVRGKSADGMAYQAAKCEVDKLREWGAKKSHAYASLSVPGSMLSAISRSACQAFARRDQGRQQFEKKGIFVRAAEVVVARDSKGPTVRLKLREKGAITFAVCRMRGGKQQILNEIIAGKRDHGDCKLRYDKTRKKWYALLSYTPDEAAPLSVDPARVVVVHRGVRNALYLMASTGQSVSIPGAKYLAQRRQLQRRMQDRQRVSPEELGLGAKGRGRARRFERVTDLGDKLGRATRTFCQQMAARAQKFAQHCGAGLIVIEDYGGIEPDSDPTLRRVLDRFPLYQMKQSIVHRGTSCGHTIKEVAAAYISTTCPRCENADSRQHNRRTGVFHCFVCDFERPADWVAALWMLRQSGADMSVWDARLARERELAEKIRGSK